MRLHCRQARLLIAIGILVAIAGCKRDAQCCKTPDCSGGSSTVVGSDVLQFRGRIPKNVLFLSLDTLRRDHLARDTTPFLNRIASEGVVMNDHQQCSNWTLGGMTCTLAGAYDTDRGHLTRLSGTERRRPPIPQGTPFLSSWLFDAGYRTAAISSNKFFDQKWGIDQGYEKFKNPPGSGEVAGSKGLGMLRKLLGSDDSPWFLHLHFTEPHAPYDADPKFYEGLEDLEPWSTDLNDKDTHYQQKNQWPKMTEERQDLLEQHLRLMYAGATRYLDAILKETWNEYDEECWLDDTLVVVWSDHGEAFWEHGFQTHAYNLTGEESDGILFFWSKNIVPGEYDGPTSAIDLTPTLLDLYGLPMPKEVTGLPIGTAPADRPIFASSISRLGAVQSVSNLGYKLQYFWKAPTFRLWDRVADPDETHNLYEPGGRVSEQLWEELRPEVQRMADLVVDEEPAPTWPEDVPLP